MQGSGIEISQFLTFFLKSSGSVVGAGTLVCLTLVVEVTVGLVDDFLRGCPARFGILHHRVGGFECDGLAVGLCGRLKVLNVALVNGFRPLVVDQEFCTVDSCANYAVVFVFNYGIRFWFWA